jgi:hypothetical protein
VAESLERIAPPQYMTPGITPLRQVRRILSLKSYPHRRVVVSLDRGNIDLTAV